jgi:hypothetical protein
VSRRSSLSDSYTRFSFYGLALRPLLKEALTDQKQTLETFLPRAVDAWIVLIELDRARNQIQGGGLLAGFCAVDGHLRDFTLEVSV